MLDQILNTLIGNPWVLAVGTIAFFTIKGILWLLIPVVVIRWRRLVLRRRHAMENSHAQAPTTHSVSSWVPESKRAA